MLYTTGLTDNNPNIPDVETEEIPLETVFIQKREGGFFKEQRNTIMLIAGDGEEALEIDITDNGCLDLFVGKNSKRDSEGNLFPSEGITLTYEQLKELTEKAYLELVRKGHEPLPFKK